MLAAEIPGDVHQLDGVERAPPAPGRAGAVRGLARERELGRDQAGAARRRPRSTARFASTCVKSTASTSWNRPSRTNHALAAEQLLGHARPEHHRAREPLALHHLLERERRSDVHRLPGVVSLAVSGRALHDRVVVGDAGLLAGLGDPVDVAAQRDDRTARAPRRPPRRRHPGDARLDLEAVLAQQVHREYARRLDLLEAQLGEAEELVHHDLPELRVGPDVRRHFFQQAIEVGGLGGGRGGEGEGGKEQSGERRVVSRRHRTASGRGSGTLDDGGKCGAVMRAGQVIREALALQPEYAPVRTCAWTLGMKRSAMTPTRVKVSGSGRSYTQARARVIQADSSSEYSPSRVSIPTLYQ